MSNNLNNASPKYRDNLLRKNLSFARTIEENSLENRTNDFGKGVNLYNNDDFIGESPNYDEIHNESKEKLIINNKYKKNSDYWSYFSDNSKNTSISFKNGEHLTNNIKYNPYSNDKDYDYANDNNVILKQNTPTNPYLDDSGNIYGTDTKKIESINMVGSFLSGDGIGLDSNNDIITSYDVRNNLPGRVMSALGETKDTELGRIQNRELLKILKNKGLSNTQREIMGKVNLNPISIIKGDPFFRPDFDITTGYNTLTKIQDTLEDFGGFKYPVNTMSESSSWYQNSDISSESITNSRIKNTGRGQVGTMFSNLKENKYVPDYEHKNLNDSNPIGKITYDKESEDFSRTKINDTDYFKDIRPDDGSLLSKTKELFEESNLVENNGVIVNKESGSGVNFNGTKILSKGSGVKSLNGLNGGIEPEKVFGRVFNKTNQYKNVKDLQRHRGLDNPETTSSSVLDSNGFVRVAPNKSDVNGEEVDMRNLMFSIENLAWAGDSFTKLPPSEKGPGDIENGNKGRIMWFPPYDLNISDNTTVNWESTNFIGRGEPIYTYNNTERLGMLNFKIIIDHPSYINDLMKEISQDVINSIISGVDEVDYKNFLSIDEQNEVEASLFAANRTVDNTEPEIDGFELFFENESTTYNTTYDDLDVDFNKISEKLINEAPSTDIIVKGFRSNDEPKGTGTERANYVIGYLKSKLNDVDNSIKLSSVSETLDGCLGDEVIESPCKKSARRVSVSFVYNPSKNPSNEPPKRNKTNGNVIRTEILRKFINEAYYFDKLSEDNPFVYDEIKNKIKFFHPSFHSITPEGFNSRLNFLQQCTRQGPTRNSNRANNMSFGAPPICILRIGDFYHTKIVIDNVNFNYEPLVWDLNPEGVGVQPMICKVDMSFKFIGGSSLKGPINELLNAVSFNFFGNTESYDKRAYKIVENDGKVTRERSEGYEGKETNEIENNDEGEISEVKRANDDMVNNVNNDEETFIKSLKMTDFKFTDDEKLVKFEHNGELPKEEILVTLKAMNSDDNEEELSKIALNKNNGDGLVDVDFEYGGKTFAYDEVWFEFEKNERVYKT